MIWKSALVPAMQPTSTPCPHCGQPVYSLATTCIHCRGPLKFNPAVVRGSIEAFRIITGWKQPDLPEADPEPMTIEFAGSADPVPEQYQDQHGPCGPLVGSATQLLSCISNAKRKDRSSLLKRHQSGQNFVRQLAPRKFEMFFRTRREFVDAQARQKSSG